MPEQPDSDPGLDAVPVPVTVVLVDGQELRGRLYSWHQTPTGWQGDVGLPLWRNHGGSDTVTVEAAEYRVWLDAPGQFHRIPGVDYSVVPAVRLPEPSLIAEALGERRPSGWVMRGGARGQGTIHAPDCAEAPQGVATLSLERALDLAERPAVRLCSLCGAAAEFSPLLRGFEDGFDQP
ncbi:DUF6233 domain-containing protein [Streptomyces sp. 2RAF24]|uniref:DUF6233 domain-containing protein n=1 Tax=Streptomyces sp. 2RAF24 TaxID=3232997 RepID=UPI003F9CF449